MTDDNNKLDVEGEMIPVPAPKRRGGQPGNSGGKKGKSGPPANMNALKHGGYVRLTLPNMPARLHNVQKTVNGFRGALEAACKESHGGISLSQAATINSCVTNERLARLWAKRLADGYANMKDSDVAICTDRIERHTKTRDESLRRLNLDRDRSQDVWDSIYSQAIPVANSGSEPTAESDDPVADSADTMDQPGEGNAADASVGAVASNEGSNINGGGEA
ncbi:MAG: hypothetical protein AB7O62_20745 [Pirellulales bacterium]